MPPLVLASCRFLLRDVAAVFLGTTASLSARAHSLAERLRELRLARGFARARHFAQALGISENRYTRYERGEAEPDVELIRVICEKLDTTPNALFGWQAASASTTAFGAEVSSAMPGFGEDADADSADAATQRTATFRGPPSTTSAADIAAWRLAHELGKAGVGVEAADASRAPLGALRITADFFLRLRENPLSVVAQILRQDKLASLDVATQAHLSAEIDRFVAAIGARAPSD